MICERMVLRADLSHAQREIVAHTTELTRESVVVRTDEKLSPGDAVSLRLSLRRLLSPFELAARVIAVDPGAGLGFFPGVTLRFEAPTPDQEEQLAALLGPIDGDGAVASPACRILVVEDSQLCLLYTSDAADERSSVD